MNNKILIGAVILILAIGAVALIAGKGGYQTPTTQTPPPTTQSAQPPTTSSSPTNETTNSAQQTTVTLTQSGFEPATITVKAGTKVVWLNKSGDVATVNSAVHPTHLVYPPLNLGEFSDGSQVSLVFDKTGTYKYHNHLNPSQTGTIYVL